MKTRKLKPNQIFLRRNYSDSLYISILKQTTMYDQDYLAPEEDQGGRDFLLEYSSSEEMQRAMLDANQVLKEQKVEDPVCLP